ncbi:MAG: hypothetical protein ACSLE5_12495 [Porticoccaceae bacterium]
MNCPKCGHEQRVQGDSCPHCGVIFAKYFKHHPPQREASELEALTIELDPGNAEDSPLKRLLFGDDDSRKPGPLPPRALLLAGLALWSWWLIGASIDSNYVGNSFLHLINLPFHEAGHVIFRPFGAFVTSLGGTLGQLLMPAICVGVLLIKTRDPFGAAVSLWWFGENFLDIAPYIDDARAGVLPLLGGNFGHSAPYGFHDWEYLLTESSLLAYDHAIANASYTLGAAIMLLALAWGGVLLHRQRRQAQDR